MTKEATNSEKPVDTTSLEGSRLPEKTRERQPMSQAFLNELVHQALTSKASVLGDKEKDKIASIKKNVTDVFAGINPRDEIEAMLVTQMIATHEATMASFLNANVASSPNETASRLRELSINQSVKLTRNYTLLMQALGAYRNQAVTNNVKVKNVNVHDGGQAIVGNVSKKENG